MGGDVTPEQVDGSRLVPIVEQLLGRRDVKLADWCGSSVPYTTFLSGRSLRSFSGTAVSAGERIPWRLILKIIRPPDAERAPATSNLPWTREVDAYRSGLLDHLPGNFRAPRAVHITRDASGVLCHHDAAQADLFARRRTDGEIDTVAIDWQFLGCGTLGADLASLVFSTLRRGGIALPIPIVSRDRGAAC